MSLPEILEFLMILSFGISWPLKVYRSYKSRTARGNSVTFTIFIALGYNLGGPALVISVLTLVLNLILTGGFVLWVKHLALKTCTPDEELPEEPSDAPLGA